MMRLRLAALFIILVVTGCAVKQPPYNPFKIPEEQFYSKIKTIALSPVFVPDGLENPDQVKTKFESLIEAKLRQQGFTVIPSREYDAVWKQMTEQVGGYFDPVTGKRDNAKFKAVRSHTLREMNTKFKADAILHPMIRVFPISFARNKAEWHGTSESLATGGTMQVLFGGVFNGTVPALSFGVNIVDSNDVDMYVNWGGIQVTSKISGSKLVAVPQSELLTNDERNSNAVDIALDLLEKKPESPQGTGSGPVKK